MPAFSKSCATGIFPQYWLFEVNIGPRRCGIGNSWGHELLLERHPPGLLRQR
ncbi:MAG: hypothetical protein QM808_16520 [Steroidobacteraceae bacterium]